MTLLYKENFPSSPEEYYYSPCHEAPFDIEYEDQFLILTCSDCGEVVSKVAIQEPLWEPEFPYEATFKCEEGKLHILFLPCKTRNPKESEEFDDLSKRQKYRMSFVLRSRMVSTADSQL